MRRAPAVALAAFMILMSIVVLVVAFAGADRGSRITALENDLRATKAQLAQTRTDLAAAREDTRKATDRAVAAEDRANRLQARVDALETALRRQGVDPGTVVVIRASSNSTQPSMAPTAASPGPVTSPSPSPSPSPCWLVDHVIRRC